MASIKKITVNGVTYDLGHSSNDFTTAEKQKLAAIAAGAQVNVIEKITTNAGNVTVTGKTVNITGLQQALTAGQGIVIEDGTIKTKFDGEVFRFVDELPIPGGGGGGVVGPNTGWRPGQTPLNFDIFKIYVVPNKSGTEGNLYNEYIWDNNKGEWELIGEFKATVDLTPYLKKNEYTADKQKIESQMSGLGSRISVVEQETNSLQKSKVEKVPGKQLSTNDYTTAEKTKLSDISTGANKVTLTVSGDTLTITTA